MRSLYDPTTMQRHINRFLFYAKEERLDKNNLGENIFYQLHGVKGQG